MQGSSAQNAIENEHIPQLAKELKDIADRFLKLSNTQKLAEPIAWTELNTNIHARSYLDIAKLIIEDRKKRDNGFSASLFADPVWDTMLALFIAELEGKPISVTSASLAAKVPMTTALRCMSMMEDSGLIIRKPAPFDRRSSNVSLTRSAYTNMIDYIENLAERWGIQVTCLVHESML